MKKSETEKKFASLQRQMDIVDIKKGTVLLSDGSVRGVLAVSSINFDLKSQEEQEALVVAYQQFLNTLDFPIQILISTKKFDVDPYLSMLSKNKKKEENSLLKNQIEDYINFIEELTEITNIMSTYFYIIIPFYPIESKKDGFFEKISSSLNPKKVIYQQRESFETFRNQLYIRMEQIMDGLSGLGLKIAPLQTEELVELFYNFYNPSEFEYNEMENIEQIEIDE
jgi:hypothetical protein